MPTARLNALWIAALLIASDYTAFPADSVPAKSLFAVQVQTLRPIAKNEPKSELQPKEPSPEAKAEAKSDKSGDTDKSDFSIESGSAKEITVEARAQQIEAMNGTPLLRSGGPGRGRSQGSSTGTQRAFDFLFPPGKQLLSKNPNARRNPLLLFEE